MATLFFEGFNIQNTDTTPYLDPIYWSRPFDPNLPRLQFTSFSTNTDTILEATNGGLRISGYFLDTNPIQQPTFIQLSGISGLNSDQIYISFRVAGLTHNDIFNNSFPFTCKLFTLCNGDSESLVFDTVRTSGVSIQGGTQWKHANSGIGISVKQSGSELGLFDLRIGDLANYAITDARIDELGSNGPLGIVNNLSNVQTRFIHLEFLIDRTNNRVNCKLEGFDILNRLTNFPYNPHASGLNNFDLIDNIKFYNRGITSTNGGSLTNSFWGFNNGAITIDDLAICNNSGNSPNMWMGPKTRIYLLRNNLYAGENSNWTLKQDWTLGAGSYTSALDTRDGDASYIFSETSGHISASPLTTPGSELFSPSSYFSNGIGGIRLFNDVRKTFLDSNFVNVYATGTGVMNNSSYVEIGPTYTVQNSTYDIKNSFIFNNPITNTPWTSGTFLKIGVNSSTNYQTSGYFGIKKL